MRCCGCHVQAVLLSVRPPTWKQRYLWYIWVSKSLCHCYTFPNSAYDEPSAWPGFLASRGSHSNSGGVAEMQQLCYTTPKCLGTLWKLIKSLACLLGETGPDPGVINRGPSPGITPGHHRRAQGLSHRPALCPAHLSDPGKIHPEGHKEIPPDLLGAWDKKATFPLGCSGIVCPAKCIVQQC